MPGNDINKIQPVMPAWVPQLTCIQDGKSTPEKLDEVRDSYLELFGKTLPQGAIILKKPGNNAVSEGIGFAGLIFTSNNSQKSQNSYWQIYKARKAYFLKNNGVMAFLVDANGNKVNADSASDGDQDWIASEIIVLNKLKSRQWKLPEEMTLSTFEKEIQKDLNAFWRAHVKQKNERLLFLPTDGPWAKRGDGREIYYSSYPDPHFLRIFAKFDKSHDWGKLADDVLDLNLEILKNHKKLGAAGQNPMPAKVFFRVSANGNYRVENYYKISRAEGVRGDALKDNEMDSIRFVALRMPRAAILDNDPKAIQILKEIIKLAYISGPGSAHILAGSPGAPSTPWPAQVMELPCLPPEKPRT
jgi:hypothetical protein